MPITLLFPDHICNGALLSAIYRRSFSFSRHTSSHLKKSQYHTFLLGWILPVDSEARIPPSSAPSLLITFTLKDTPNLTRFSSFFPPVLFSYFWFVMNKEDKGTCWLFFAWVYLQLHEPRVGT